MECFRNLSRKCVELCNFLEEDAEDKAAFPLEPVCCSMKCEAKISPPYNNQHLAPDLPSAPRPGIQEIMANALCPTQLQQR